MNIQDIQRTFEREILPGVMRNAKALARRNHYGKSLREEMLAEIGALAWHSYFKARRSGRDDLHAGNIWWVVKRRWSTQRPFSGRTKPRDVLSKRIQLAEGYEVIPLHTTDEKTRELIEQAVLKKIINPARKAIFAMDFEAFQRCLSHFQRKILRLRLADYTVAEISRMVKCSYDKVRRALLRAGEEAVIAMHLSLR